MWDAALPGHLENLPQDDILEVYSPPRIVARCNELGLVGDLSADLQTGWDLDLHDARLNLVFQIKARRPKVAFLEPPCTYHTRLQHMNWLRLPVEKREIEFLKHHRHLEFAMFLADLQASAGRGYAFEAPAGSLALTAKCVEDVTAGHFRASFHGCMFGYKAVDGTPTMKSTVVITNVVAIYNALHGRKCDRSHQHRHIGGKDSGGASMARASQVYPPQLVDAVANAIAKHCRDNS
jgi:hypothetical protein